MCFSIDISRLILIATLTRHAAHRSPSVSVHAEKSTSSGGARQMLGMKGASDETDIWKIRVQLTKPVTWIPLIWGVACGAAASGHYIWNDPKNVAQLLVSLQLSYFHNLDLIASSRNAGMHDDVRPFPHWLHTDHQRLVRGLINTCKLRSTKPWPLITAGTTGRLMPSTSLTGPSLLERSPKERSMHRSQSSSVLALALPISLTCGQATSSPSCSILPFSDPSSPTSTLLLH